MRINNKKGFTLIELMVVIAIIGILATSGISMYSSYQAKARDTNRMTNINQLTVGLEGYKTDISTYPKIANGCLSDEKGAIADETLRSYFDNKNIFIDPNGTRKAGNCLTLRSMYYKPLLRLTEDDSYILGASVETKTNANFRFDTSKVANYQAANEEYEAQKVSKTKATDFASISTENTMYVTIH